MLANQVASCGFEASGTVEAAGAGVTSVRSGDAVAVYLPELGGYAGQVPARYWVKVPEQASAEDAAALPASGEAATRVVTGLLAAGQLTLRRPQTAIPWPDAAQAHQALESHQLRATAP